MKLFKKIGLIAIVMFSFYYTEKIAGFVLEKNELYQEINDKKEQYEIKSVSAQIDDENIIPGLEGISVNIKDSYYNMKSLNVFNSYYLIYENIAPVVSIESNVDKIIIKGNSNKNSVALVLEYDQDIINHLNNYNISVLVDMNNFNKEAKYEQINNEVSNFKRIENLINKYSNNTNICVISSNNETICRDNKMFLVKPNKELSDSTYLALKDNVESGDIILIKKGTKIEYIDIIIKSVLFKDYKINYLSKHISEERD